MYSYKSSYVINIAAFLIIIAVFIIGILYENKLNNSNRFSNIKKVEAGSSQNVSGFAWSENIGWISFNCLSSAHSFDECASSDYGVNINRNTGPDFGLISGYAYSDNIGFITFNKTELTGCPSGSCEGRLGTDSSGNLTASPDNVTGWARACTVFATGCTGALKSSFKLGGWDGFISLRGTSPNYGVYLDTVDSKLKGFAWGDLVVGWIDFIGLNLAGGGLAIGPPVVNLSADDTTPDVGTPITLTWAVSGGVTECHSTGGEFGWGPVNDPKIPASGGSEITSAITAPQAFSIQCSNSSGNSNISEVNVLPISPFSFSTNPLSANPTSVPDLLNQETDLTWTISEHVPASCILSATPAVAEWTGTISGADVTEGAHTRFGVDVAKRANGYPQPTTTYSIDCDGVVAQATVTRKWVRGDGICESLKGESIINSLKSQGGDCAEPVFQEV